jgi:hypothetical protein
MTPDLASSKDMLHRHAIQPIQPFAYSREKKATDGDFIIDAMHLLYGGRVMSPCAHGRGRDPSAVVRCGKAAALEERRLASANHRHVISVRDDARSTRQYIARG